jgi:hypothetical protein
MVQCNYLVKEVFSPEVLLEKGFCVRRAEVQNSKAVFQLNFSNNIGFCASKTRPNAKPRTVGGHCKRRHRNRKKVTK